MYLTHLLYRHIVHQSIHTAVENGYLFAYRHWAILGLYKQLVVLTTTVQGHGGHSIHVARELGETLKLTILRHVNLQCTSHFLHTLDLSRTSHTRNGDTHVDGRTESLVEKVGLQINLTISNGNNVGRNVGRNVTCLSLDDRKSGERTATLYMTFHTLWQVIHLLGNLLLVVDAGCTLQQTRVQIEHITRIGLTS